MPMPPTKLACLHCRASRTRCDGELPCHNCEIRDRDCSYVPSKRGGSRKRRIQRNPINERETSRSPSTQLLTPESIKHFVFPGAGLKRPEAIGEQQQFYATSETLSVTESIDDHCARIYDSEQAILNAYYIFIHQYFPILPPPKSRPTVDCPIQWPLSVTEKIIPHQPISPLSLALSAVLALIPLSQETRCTAAACVSFRKALAQQFAQAALQCIDADSEYLDFISDRQIGSMTAVEQRSISREPLHPQTPVELESILALLLLSNYEHTERANLLKMTARASQALIIAKNMSLHRMGLENDAFSEAKRRAWWMTYFCAHLCSVVRQSACLNVDDDSHFTTPYPKLESDPEAWLIFLEALRIGVASVKFTTSYSERLNSHSDMSRVFEQMKILDKWVLQVSARIENYVPNSRSMELDPTYESVTAEVMRRLARIRLSSTRIRLHRFQAFSDTPLFTENHCDLTVPSTLNTSSNITNDAEANIAVYTILQSPPFTNDQSTEICVASALTIARQLQRLPIAKTSDGVINRAMPTCTCCAMQASYVLLMQFYKLHVTPHTTQTSSCDMSVDTERLIDELRHGLEDIIGAMNNFAASFEAIAGMRDEIEIAYHIAFPHMATVSK
ncbi:fungal zn(2)-Cys(6) binuclear cluster domain-containing protein [Trichoderma breve]|uniref:Fungal zn(2)-Cys(6) binuclear cluster domain-containing protein n=1 Tax=Trichoderma breve TaxID=2034170 RepID=A0A9W9E7Z0_9HYPO|nr:fungal zn(2)-Cys(6) binuclear cluster domain-containing protein [Trichoderma breve]KAJ4859882.1 fungal zn(2)-Cys(6) binuclear cluster domain-containing protein [Trichoderma breve]